MGYFTSFSGSFAFDRPLLPRHAEYIRKFTDIQHVKRLPKLLEGRPDPEREAVDLPVGDEGEYVVNVSNERDATVLSDNPPGKQPSKFCDWVLAEDELHLIWNDSDKFTGYVEWLDYLIERFFKPWGYVLNGRVHWEGEDRTDRGTIIVRHNVLEVKTQRISDSENKVRVAQLEIIARDREIALRANAASSSKDSTIQGFNESHDTIFRQTVEAIKPGLHSSDIRTRRDALKAIGQLGIEAKRITIPILYEYLTHETDAGFRADAACIIGEIAPESEFTTPFLIEALKDRRATIRESAALGIAYGPAKPEAAIPLLFDLLKDKKTDLRYAALTALGKIASTSDAIAAAINALSDDEVPIRKCAISVLEERGSKSTEAVTALKKQKSDATVAAEVDRALSSLGATELPPSLDKLITMLTENAPAVREAAFTEIKAQAAKSDVVVRKLMEVLSSSARNNIRARMAWALGRLGALSQAAVPALALALEDDDCDVGRAAALALSQIGPAAKSAEPALRKATQSKSVAVRFQAEQALKAISVNID